MGSAASSTILNSGPGRVAARSSWLTQHGLLAAAFAALFVGALTVRLATFERYLPYIDVHEEPWFYLLTQAWRGADNVPSHVGERLNGYPPLYIWVNMGVQVAFEKITHRAWYFPSDYVYAAHVFAVGLGLATTLAMISIGWQLAGPIAGWVAGFIWAFSPLILDHNSRAIPDPLLYFTCAVAIALAVRAWKIRSPIWASLSLLAGIAAIYTKYWPIQTLIPWGLVILYLLIQRPRTTLPWLICQGLIAGLAAGFLLNHYSSSSLGNQAHEIIDFSNNGLLDLLSFDRNRTNFEVALRAIGAPYFWIAALTGTGAYLYSRRRGWPHVDWRWAAIVLLYTVGGILIISSFIVIDGSGDKTRHAIPSSIGLMILVSLAVTQIVWTLQAGLRSLGLSRNAFVAPLSIGLIVGLGLGIPFWQGQVRLRENLGQPHHKYILWKWADENIPLDGRILMLRSSDLEDTWNRAWSGYNGKKSFDWWFIENDGFIASPDEYAERGISYFVIRRDERQRDFNTPEAQVFVNALMPVKTFNNIGPAGTTIEFYRLKPPNVETNDVVFGDQIALAGYDLNADDPAPGEALKFRPYWRALKPPANNYSMFVHLYPVAKRDQIIAQHDGAPSTPERLTLTWTDLDELYIGADVSLPIPADVPPGDYAMAIGLYDFASGARLLTDTGTDGFVIPFHITS